MRYDQHLHSNHSFDSPAEPEQMVLRAIQLQLDGITFTEHFDTHPEDWPQCRYNEKRIAEDIARLRDRHGHRIFIGKGIEICSQPQRQDAILRHLHQHQFDLVILSVHWAADRAFHLRNHWKDLTPASGTDKYLRGVLEAAQWAHRLAEKHGRVFDVLGHLDLVRRYTHRFFNEPEPPVDMALIDEIFHACLAAQLIPEVNTSTLRGGAGHPMPAEPIIARYAAHAGRAMTLGSDAHVPEHIAADFPQCLDMLRRCGITHQAVFRDRTATLTPLA